MGTCEGNVIKGLWLPGTPCTTTNSELNEQGVICIAEQTTLRLNRIVEQRVIVGHYKPISAEDTEASSSDKNEDTDTSKAENANTDVRTRTVVVIPVDNEEIGEIPVNVCEGDVLTIYESLVNIKSVTEARDMVKESLCLDFEVKPGLKLLAKVENEKKYENVKHGQPKPPPLPARPDHQLPLRTAFDGEYAPNSLHKKRPEDDDYLEPITHRTRPNDNLHDYIDMTGTRHNAPSAGGPLVPPRIPTHIPLPTHKNGKKDKDKDKKYFWQKPSKKAKSNAKENKQRPPMPDPPLQAIPEDDGLAGYEEISKLVKIDKRISGHTPEAPSDDLGDYEEINGLSSDTSKTSVFANSSKGDKTLSGYDEIEDVIALHEKARFFNEPEMTKEVTEKHTFSTSNPNTSVSNFHSELTDKIKKQTQAASITSPKSKQAKDTNKLFQDLTNEELVDRLELCNLQEIAETCKDEKLDGAFFTDETPESLKETFGLKGIKLAKFLKMRDENWVSK